MAKGNHSATGRPPSKAPRTNYVTVKLSDAEKERLDEAARILGTTKTKIVVEGINTIHAQAVAAETRRKKEKLVNRPSQAAINKARLSFGDFDPPEDVLMDRAREIEEAYKIAVK